MTAIGPDPSHISDQNDSYYNHPRLKIHFLQTSNAGDLVTVPKWTLFQARKAHQNTTLCVVKLSYGNNGRKLDLFSTR